jgi:polysaccharide export outer membrane protein
MIKSSGLLIALLMGIALNLVEAGITWGLPFPPTDPAPASTPIQTEEVPPVQVIPLSSGDRIEVLIPADDEKFISGFYKVSQDGTIPIPFLGSFPVAGLSPSQATTALALALTSKDLFRAGIEVEIRILHYGPIEVQVTGAVFDPGAVTVNQQPLELDAGSLQSLTQLPGDSPRRRLTDALRAAGGITPVADLTQVQVMANSPAKTYDLSGIFTGAPYENPFLPANTQIRVPKGAFQADQVRPSIITPPDLQVFISSLTIPAESNSSASVETGSKNFGYGTRFSQAMGPANCLGGTKSTNSNRIALLSRTDRKTGRVYVLERRVENLDRNSNNDEENPFLMPGDLVACYDSDTTSLRDFFRTLGDIILPFSLFLF